MPPSQQQPDPATLLQLTNLITTTTQSLIELRSTSPSSTSPLPSPTTYDLQRTLISASAMLSSLISDPRVRLLEISSQYLESRALHIMVEKRVPNILAKGGESGLHIKDLAEEVGIEARKLARLMRTLCSNHVFQEVAPDTYSNNHVSAALVDNDAFRAYILILGLEIFTATDHLPRTLSHPVKGQSYSVSETAFQDGLGITKTRWEWLREKTTIGEINEQKVGYPGYPFSGMKGNEKTEVPRPELDIFGLGMTAGGEILGTAHVYDYPWKELGKATIVDVGGGVGGFCLQLSSIYPDLSFIVQDSEEFLRQGQEEVWPAKAPEVLASGRVTFMAHDFFTPNPVEGAAIYWLRYILHDWPDDHCVKILASLKPSLASTSRVLLCEQVMNTTLGCAEIPPAPKPLPANYGVVKRYSHQRDLVMLTCLNGIERTPAQFNEIVEKAGLKVEKFWDVRSQVSLVELRLP